MPLKIEPAIFTAIIQKHSLGSVTIKADDPTFLGIPNRGHSIWLGSEFPPPLGNFQKDGKTWNEKIISLKKFNPEFNHVLWMDRDDFNALSTEKRQSTIDFCNSNQIAIICFQDVFKPMDRIEEQLMQIYQIKHREKNYAGASDVLRMMILRRFYGLYYDTDDAIVATFREKSFSSTHMQANPVSNDLLSMPQVESTSNPAYKEMEEACEKIITDNKKSLQEVLANGLDVGLKSYSKIDYTKNYHTLPYFFIRRAHTIRTTGPEITSTNDENRWINMRLFYYVSAETWLGNKGGPISWRYWDAEDRVASISSWSEFSFINNLDDIKECQLVIRELLDYYYSLEPRTLRFDFFRIDIQMLYLVKDINVEHVLFMKFVGAQNTIEYIPFNLFVTFKKIYQLLFDRNNFPSLIHEMYLPEIALLIRNDSEADEFFKQERFSELYVKASALEVTSRKDPLLLQRLINKPLSYLQLSQLLNQFLGNEILESKLSYFIEKISENLALLKIISPLRVEREKPILALSKEASEQCLINPDSSALLAFLASHAIILTFFVFKPLTALEKFLLTHREDMGERIMSCLVSSITNIAGGGVLVNALQNKLSQLADFFCKNISDLSGEYDRLSLEDFQVILECDEFSQLTKEKTVNYLINSLKILNEIIENKNNFLMNILWKNAINMTDVVVSSVPKERVVEVSFSLLVRLIKLRQQRTTDPSIMEYISNSMRALSALIIAEKNPSELAEIVDKFLVNYSGDEIGVRISSLYFIFDLIKENKNNESQKNSLILYQEQLVKCLEYFIDKDIDIVSELAQSPVGTSAIALLQQALEATIEVSKQFSLPELHKQVLLKEGTIAKCVLQGLNTYLLEARAVKSSQVLSADSLFSSREDPKNAAIAKVYQVFLDSYDGHEKLYLVFALLCKTDLPVPSEKLQSDLSKKLGFASLAEARKMLAERINKELTPRGFSSEEFIREIAIPLNQAASKGYDPLNDKAFKEGYGEVMDKIFACAYPEEEDDLESGDRDSLENK